MRQLNSKSKIKGSNPRLFSKMCDPCAFQSKMGAPHTDSFLQSIGEVLRYVDKSQSDFRSSSKIFDFRDGKKATPSTKIAERIKFLYYLNFSLVGDIENA